MRHESGQARTIIPYAPKGSSAISGNNFQPHRSGFLIIAVKESSLDAPSFGDADAPVNGEGFPQLRGTLAEVSFPDLASPDSFEYPCFLDRYIDVAGDAECYVVLTAGLVVRL